MIYVYIYIYACSSSSMQTFVRYYRAERLYKRKPVYMRMFNSYLGAFGDIPARCSFCYKKFKCLSFYENTFVANIRRINLMLFLGIRSIWEAPI